MHAEAFEFASNQPDSELTQFYKTEALLAMKMKSGMSYSKAVASIVSNEHSYLKIAQTAKALLKENRTLEACEGFAEQTLKAQKEEEAEKEQRE